MVLTAALAGTAGGWLALRREAAIRKEAAAAARHKCEVAVLRRVFAKGNTPKPLHLSDLLFGIDILLVGSDGNGWSVASVEGHVQAPGADGSKLSYQFECALSFYDTKARAWGSLAMSM
jgi:hypothetical protein